MKLSEDAQTQCNKCDIWDDVANMKADGHDKFLCIECAYVQLEAENKQLQANFKWAMQERGRESAALKRMAQQFVSSEPVCLVNINHPCYDVDIWRNPEDERIARGQGYIPLAELRAMLNEHAALKRKNEQLGSTVDSQQVWVEKYKTKNATLKREHDELKQVAKKMYLALKNTSALLADTQESE